jgi:hypothetical protein
MQTISPEMVKDAGKETNFRVRDAIVPPHTFLDKLTASSGSAFQEILLVAYLA